VSPAVCTGSALVRKRRDWTAGIGTSSGERSPRRGNPSVGARSCGGRAAGPGPAAWDDEFMCAGCRAFGTFAGRSDPGGDRPVRERTRLRAYTASTPAIAREHWSIARGAAVRPTPTPACARCWHASTIAGSADCLAHVALAPMSLTTFLGCAIKLRLMAKLPIPATGIAVVYRRLSETIPAGVAMLPKCVGSPADRVP
jgi:hypothetical protein